MIGMTVFLKTDTDSNRTIYSATTQTNQMAQVE